MTPLKLWDNLSDMILHAKQFRGRCIRTQWSYIILGPHFFFFFFNWSQLKAVAGKISMWYQH